MPARLRANLTVWPTVSVFTQPLYHYRYRRGQVAERADNSSMDEMVTLLAVWIVPLVILFGVVYFAVRLATRNSRRS